MDSKELIARIDLREMMVPGRGASGNRPVMMRCPWHHDTHASMAVYRDGMYCFGCQRYQGVLDFLAEKEGVDLNLNFREGIELLMDKYGGGKPLPVMRHPAREEKAHDCAPMDKDIVLRYHQQLGAKRKWFLDRGLCDETIDAQKLGHNGRDAYTIPVWDTSGQLITIRYRRDDVVRTDGSKYWGVTGRNDTILYNKAAVKGAEYVVLCEGELDCLRIFQEGIPAVSSTNGAGGIVSLWPRISSLFRCGRIIIAMDQDEGGQKAASELKKMINGTSRKSLDSKRSVIMRWNPVHGKDVTELACKKGIDFLRGIIRLCLMKS